MSVDFRVLHLEEYLITVNLFLGDDDPVLKRYVWDMCVGIDYVWCEIRQQSYEEPATKHPSGKIAQNCWIKT